MIAFLPVEGWRASVVYPRRGLSWFSSLPRTQPHPPSHLHRKSVLSSHGADHRRQNWAHLLSIGLSRRIISTLQREEERRGSSITRALLNSMPTSTWCHYHDRWQGIKISIVELHDPTPYIKPSCTTLSRLATDSISRILFVNWLTQRGSKPSVTRVVTDQPCWFSVCRVYIARPTARPPFLSLPTSDIGSYPDFLQTCNSFVICR